MSTLATVTLAHGRHRHLQRQHDALAGSTRPPDVVVVVAMGDPAVADLAAAGPCGDRVRVVTAGLDQPGGRPRLPLARARNLGVEAAAQAGADLLVVLDVDCMVTPGTLGAYEEAARLVGSPALLAGPVAYLEPPADGKDWTPTELAAAAPHPGRPAPPDGVVEAADDLRLFWSLSFALDLATWRAIGGFDEAYTGYGGEDTDFGQRAAAAGVPMHWVGGALAHHQWHPVSDPPVEHVDDIVRNANIFAGRWGWWPMETWLAEFERRGLVARSADGTWCVTPPRSGSAPTRGGQPSASAPR